MFPPEKNKELIHHRRKTMTLDDVLQALRLQHKTVYYSPRHGGLD